MKRIQAIVAIIGVVLLVGGFMALRGISGSGSGGDDGLAGDGATASAARIGTIDDGGAEITWRGGERAGRSVQDFSSRRAGDGRSTGTAEASNSDEVTSEPLVQEAYIAALMAMIEKDGKDNALLHYALAFELAPDNPTERQNELIQLVLDEGWDERAEELLPYLEQWDAAFAKLYEGAHVGYARGFGSEMGYDTPEPAYELARKSARLLAVYSRYLESQGRHAEAASALEVMMNMGRDFKSPENLVEHASLGIEIQDVALGQMASFVEKGRYAGSERTVIEQLRYMEASQPSFLSYYETQMQAHMTGINKILTVPGYLEQLTGEEGSESAQAEFQEKLEQFAEASEIQSVYFSEPYWNRTKPDYTAYDIELDMYLSQLDTAELSHLKSLSKMRQQQIDLAAQAYMAQHQVPPPDTGALVSGGYLPEVPTDPFTGQDFVYKPTENGYELYGSGPVIDKPVDPAVEYDSANGTMNEGVIRLR